MALQTTDNIIHHVADGIQLEFSYNFRVDDASDMQVFTAGVLIDPVNYVLTGIGEDDGGLVTYLDPPADGARITLTRVVPATQETVYPDYGPFPAKSHELALDKLTMLAQQSISSKETAITVPPTEAGLVDLVAPPIELRRNRVLAFDNEGNVTVAAGEGESSGTIVGISRGESGYVDATDLFRVDNTTGGQRLPLLSVTPLDSVRSLMQLDDAGAIPAAVLARSPFTLGVDPEDVGGIELLTVVRSAEAIEVVGVHNVNAGNHLMTLNPIGAIPFDILEKSLVVVDVAPEIIVDGGGAGVDLNLLTVTRTLGGIETVGVNSPNTANYLLQLDDVGAIPAPILDAANLVSNIDPDVIVDGGGLGVDIELLTVVRSTGGLETIGVNNPNTANYLLRLDVVGSIPDAILEADTLIKTIVPAVTVDGGGAGVDINLLTAVYTPGGLETIGVNAVNTANYLMRLDDAGKIPASILELDTVVQSIVVADNGGQPLLTAVYAAGGTETIGVNGVNVASRLLQLNSAGAVQDSILELSTVVRNIVPEVIVDGGGAGIDVELLTSIYAAGGTETVGVSAPNQADHLLQLDHFGQVPAEVLRLQGLRNRGTYRGDDECDKIGDEAGDCTAPDYRDPTERFPSLDPLLYDDPDGTPSVPPNPAPSVAWQAGDFFSIHNGADGVGGTFPDGSINLWHSDGGSPAAWVREPVVVSPSDGIQYVPEVLDPDDGVTVLFPEGWYHLPDRFNLTTADLVSMTPLPNYLSGPSVQHGMQQADSQLLVNSDAAVAAQGTADQAIIDAGTAQAAAVAAQATADQAAIDAGTAQTTADTANATANSALTNAGLAQTDATQALADAATAQGVADAADLTANEALTTAGNAQTDATQALADALAAQNTANTANSTANSALTAAGNAQTAADQAALDASAAQGDATQALADALAAQNTANDAATAASNAQGTADGAASSISTHIATKTNPHEVTASQCQAEPANANLQAHLLDMGDPHNVTPSQVGAEPANANIQSHIGSTGNVHGATAGQVGAPAGSWSWDVPTSTLYITTVP